MNRYLTAPIRLGKEQPPAREHEEWYESYAQVDLTHELVSEWCLALSLLWCNLVDAVVVVSPISSDRLTVRLNVEDPDTDLLRWGQAGMELSLSERELGGWIHFFLEYVRDGMGRVDHVDLLVSAGKSDGNTSGIVTVTVPIAARQFSFEELARLARQRRKAEARYTAELESWPE